MKIVRITDDRYVLDVGTDMSYEKMEMIKSYWEEWWATESIIPTVLVLGGAKEPLEYEDRREPDVSRLTAIEEKLDHIWEALS